MQRQTAPRALKRLNELRALREGIGALRACLEREKTARGLSAGPLSEALDKYQRRLDALTDDTRRRILRLGSPREEMLLRLIFLDGIDSEMISSGLGLSASGFRVRLAKALGLLEKKMEQGDGK